MYDELLQKTAQGDQLAFHRLYEECSPKLMSFCMILMKTKVLAEDLLQESFIEIWDKADTYTPNKGKAMTWILAIIQKIALVKLRSF